MLPCDVKNCKCKCFFYVVAEGAWILRCRCKHKHIEHDCSTQPFGCLNSKCQRDHLCNGFDSPWVCNCSHVWSSHRQFIEYKQDGTNISSIDASGGVEGNCKFIKDESNRLVEISRKQFSVRKDGFTDKEIKDIQKLR
mmetsp:Transcript_8078/g.12071  ORF Transcript_8078/g.12071 Transcript_8078/m.12071 type:complete len:138 (-) Transcript_8078:71-484(-)